MAKCGVWVYAPATLCTCVVLGKCSILTMRLITYKRLLAPCLAKAFILIFTCCHGTVLSSYACLLQYCARFFEPSSL